MPTTYSMREQIIAAFVSRLGTAPTGITKPTGLEVHRYRLRPLEEDNLPALVVYWTSCEPSERAFISAPCLDRLLEYTLHVRVEIRTTGDPVDQAIDACARYLRQCVFYDPSFGGLALATREGSLQVDGESRGEVMASGTLDFEVSFFDELYTPTETLLGAPIQRLDFEQRIPTEPGIATLVVEDTPS